MANKVFNMAGGLHSAAALSAYIDEMFGDSVARGLNVVPTGSSGMAVTIKAGTGNISTGQQYGRMIQADADQNVTLTAASPTFARIDTVIAWIDGSVAPTTSVTDNTNGILKFQAVAGTASGTPQAPTDAQIQSAIGSGNPFMRLANVTVPANASSILATNISDVRNQIFPLKTNMIGEKAVQSHNINFATLGGIAIRKDGTTSQTTQLNAYTQINYSVTEFNTSDVLRKVGNTVKNISNKTLLVIAAGTVAAGSAVPSLTARLSKTSDTANAIGFVELSNARGVTACGIAYLEPDDTIQLEVYQQITAADQRNRLNVAVLAVIS